MGEILGATLAMALFGYAAAWALRKLTKMAVTPSYIVGVLAMTAIGAWVYSTNSRYTVTETWAIYAIGGMIALSLMLAAEWHKQGNLWPKRKEAWGGVVRTLAIWLFGLLAGGLAGAIASIAIIEPSRDGGFFTALGGFVCGLCAFACMRLWLATPVRNSN